MATELGKICHREGNIFVECRKTYRMREIYIRFDFMVKTSEPSESGT
jgi:hypothetical protein